MTIPPCLPWQCGKEFRSSLHKPSPVVPKKPSHKRHVPAFTIQALQKNTIVIPPPQSNYLQPQYPDTSSFRKCYSKGEFPVTIGFGKLGKMIKWKVDINSIDYGLYLPIFFEGIAEAQYPFSFIVHNGLKELIAKGNYKILPVIPQLIIPIKNALNTKIPAVICRCLLCIQALVQAGTGVGEALVPYYRQILPVFNQFKGKGRDYMTPQKREENVGDLVEDTLMILEEYGGPDAFINIKYMVPTYESCIHN